MAVRAEPKATEAPQPTNPAATPQLAPLDLSLHPAATPQSAPLDLSLHPATTPPSTSLDFSVPPAATPQATSLNLAAPPATMQPSTPTVPTPRPGVAPQWVPGDVALQSASAEVKRVARWVSDSRDNAGLPYLLVDKANAQVFAFSPAGELQAMAPALLGMSKGDRLLVPNTAMMSQMPPSVRITPAGRFVSRLAIDSHGKELLVLDYDASISMHPVIKGTPQEHRAERLASITSADNRISFGCINVPPSFYTSFVHADFAQTKGIVYVLPEMSAASQLFGFQPFDAAPAAQQVAMASVAAPAAQQVSTASNAGAVQAVSAPGAK